ncbi:MAG: hypothetical protein AB7M93_26005 [Candidatus Obscuribacterales bacterium]
MRSLALLLTLFLSESLLAAEAPNRPPISIEKAHELATEKDNAEFSFIDADELGFPCPIYSIRVSDLPGKQYDYCIVNLRGDAYSYTAQVGDDHLLRAYQSGPLATVFPVGYMPGEPCWVYLVSVDQQIAGVQKLIPHPWIEQNGRYTARVEVADPSAELFTLYIEGFEPNEFITLESISCHEYIPPHSIRLDSTGTQLVLYAPAVIGEDGGSFVYRAYGVRGGVVLRGRWGKHYYDYHNMMAQNEVDQATEYAEHLAASRGQGQLGGCRDKFLSLYRKNGLLYAIANKGFWFHSLVMPSGQVAQMILIPNPKIPLELAIEATHRLYQSRAAHKANSTKTGDTSEGAPSAESHPVGET